jgi:peptide/nickel transport system substrate-binding protein
MKSFRRLKYVSGLLVIVLVLSACGPAATPVPAQPTTAPPAVTQPTAAPTTAPAAPVQPTAVVQPTAAAVQPPPSTKGTCGTLKVLWWQAPTILNPHLAQGQKDYDASRLVYEPLAAVNEKGEPDIRYGLAAEVPTLQNGGISADGKTITWKLKSGVKWSDGSAFTADDVIFTYQFASDKATAATTSNSYADIDKIEKVNDTTVKITWKQSNPTPYVAFTGLAGYIIQKKAFADYMGAKAKDAPGNLKPVGTGPYIVKEFKPGDVVTYDLNPNYRDTSKPCFKEVNFKGGGDATSAARAALQTGDVDWSWNLQVAADVLVELGKGGKGEVVIAPGASVERLLLQRTDVSAALGDKRGEPVEKGGKPHPFLTDLKVRKALAIAIPRNQIGAELYGDGMSGRATCNIIVAPPALVSSTTFDSCDLKGNLDQANKWLDEAGWVKGADGIRAKGGVKMNIIYQTTVNPVRQKTQEIVKQAWEKLGIKVELKAVQAGVFFSSDVGNPDTAAKFWTDVEMFTNGPSQTDDIGYVRNHTCAEIKTKDSEWRGGNYDRYCNPEYDKLIDQLAKELEPAKRAAIYKQLNDIFNNDVIEIPLVARNNVSGKSKALKGVVANSWDSDLWNVLDWTNK